MLRDPSTNSCHKLTLAQFKMPSDELEKRLLAAENLSLCYFLSRKSDGQHWRRLHSIIGGSVLKYLILYSFMFRRVDDQRNTHVQICGVKLSYVYKGLVAKRLGGDRPEEGVGGEEARKVRSLKAVFEVRERELAAVVESRTSVVAQLNRMGHCSLNKTSMLYSRDLGKLELVD